MNLTPYSRFHGSKLFALLCGLALIFHSVPPASAISLYGMQYSAVPVGTATGLLLYYTVDSTEQTWADDDTLTFTLPANLEANWSALTFTAEFDQDQDDDGVGETPITEGVGLGQYSLSGTTLTVKWNETAWTAENGDTVRVNIDSAVFRYADATTSFTFGGSTAAGGDTNPAYTIDVNFAAADASAVVSLGANSVVGATGDTTVTLTLPINLAATDTVDVTFPSYLDVSDVAFGSDTFAGAGSFTCTDSGQVVTCTATGAITAGTGNLVLTNIFSIYTASTDITSLEVERGGVAANDVATDGAVALTNVTAADAAASVTLGANYRVGVSGSTTVDLTLPINLAATDTVDITFPSYLDVSEVELGSETFAGAGTFTCAAAGQVVTCTADGAITSGAGSLVLTGILASSTGTTDITSLEVEKGGVDANNVATDSIVSLTDVIPNRAGIPMPNNGGGSSSGSSDENEEVFTDLDPSSDYYEAILDLYERGIIEGYENGSIQAETGINRAELMKIVVLAVAGEPDPEEYKNCFTDVREEWFAPTLCYAKEQGWVDGYPDGSFGPGGTANNVEVLKMILNVNGIEVPAPTGTEAWYTPYLRAAEEMGVIEGSNFEPGTLTSRGHAFQWLSDLLARL